VGPREVSFGVGRRALLLTADHRPAADLVVALGLDPPADGRPVIVVCGGAGNLTGTAFDRARDMIEDAVAPVAAATGAAVVDGGTASGVMRLTGAARSAQPDRMPVLVGVAPAGLVSYPDVTPSVTPSVAPSVTPDGVPLDAGHTHFVLADSDRWGGETSLLMETAQALAGSGRVAVVVMGGGPVTQAEVAEAQRRGWPILAVTGTGGVADTIAGRADVRLASDAVEGARQLSWELRDDPPLKEAWQLLASYDQQAKRLRIMFTRLVAATLILGLTGTLLALVHDEIGGAALHWAVVVVPAVASALIAVSSRGSFGQRWVQLRTAAESVKAEIYRHRAHAATADTDQQLVSRLAAIENRLVQSAASSAPLPLYRGPLPPVMYGAEQSDDGLSPLDHDGYLRTRVAAQIAYYRGRIGTLARLRNTLYLLGIVAGAAGTVLATVHLDLWVSVTGGASAAARADRGRRQVDSTIVGYNQALVRLGALEREWRALRSPQRTAEAFERLVDQCESTLTAEVSGWVKHLNEAAADASAPSNQ